MKKSFLIILSLVIGFSGFSFATPSDKINNQVTESFNRDFANARDVQWQTKKAYIKATFDLNGSIVSAYYQLNGSLIGISRNILSEKLPIGKFLSLKNAYPNYWISDLFEVDSNGETTYYITLENAETKLVVSSSNNDGWQVYRKEIKE